MNRTIALFVGLAVLLAHTLAIHDTAADAFGPPYDVAHVAYRLSRNIVFDGSFRWSADGAGLDCYPSPAWIAITALAQRAYLGVNLFSQTFGIVSALLTVVVLSRFRKERAAGLIAPLFLVVSGSLAAAAASGTEMAFFTLLGTFAFHSYEEKHWRRFAAALALLCATRPEGAILTLGFLVMRLVRRSESETPIPRRLAPFVPAGLWIGAVWTLRALAGEPLLSPVSGALLEPSLDRARVGLAFVGRFALTQVTPLLVIYPLALVCARKLPPIGKRGLFLAALWTSVVVASGGVSLPFGQALCPALPFLFLAIQAAAFKALDLVGLARRVTLVLLGAAIVLGGLASRTPSDVGPFPVHDTYATWFGKGVAPSHGSDGHLGRLGLAQEIRNTRRLRRIGLFIRDHVDPSHTVLTPWPGSAGYLARHEIVDLFGRTHRWPGQERLRPWLGEPRTDVLIALDSKPDYVVISIGPRPRAPAPRELAEAWIRDYDTRPDDAGRVAELVRRFADYEAFAAPVDTLSEPGSRDRFLYLLRRRDLGLTPRIDLTVSEGRFAVDVRHPAHRQICDLRLTLVDENGDAWPVNPTGKAVDGEAPVARAGLLLYPSDRPFHLMEGALPELPDAARAVELRAVLSNPGTHGAHAFAVACDEVRVEL